MHRSEMWPEIEKVFNEAVELDPPDRAKFLDKACCGNEELRRELESLLAQTNKDGLLGNPALDAAAPMVSQIRTGSWRLSPGMRLGPYEITTSVGKGGMAEVYRARDTKLHRDAAIKVLPETFAQDRERIARFRREAQVLASLNHPRIAAIYGIEEHDGVWGLALEFVDGETLAERIARGRLPLDEALEFATQIAEALEAAHARGVVHRDLKPANIKITRDGTTKVLDFGLAKIFQPELSQPNSPTNFDVSTNANVIVGTAAYMSPEQARGKEVDKRTDIWAWGCVLYEMLTGRRAFDGDTATDVISKIAAEEPDWTKIPENTRRSVRNVLHRALQKDPSRRIHDIADARIEIEEARNEPTTVGGTVKPGRRREYLPWGATLVMLVFALAALYFQPTLVDIPETRLEMVPPPGTSLIIDSAAFAISPDGRSIVFKAITNGKTQLWLRRLESEQAEPLEYTEGAFAQMFWSPDSSLEPNQSSQRFPIFLPDGRHFLFLATGPPDVEGIWLGSLDSQHSRRLFAAGSKPMFVLPNYVLFVREQTLFAQPLDMDNFEPIREPFIVADNIPQDDTAFGLSAFSASASGTLAYRAAVAQTRQWTWVNRLGKAMGTVGEPDSMDPASRGAGRLSRDGRTLAFQRHYNIWLMDMIRGSLSRFTRGPWADGRPVWSPHGDRIAFWSSRRKGGGNNDLFVKPVDDAGTEVPLLERSENLNVWDWSPDGRYILYALQRPQALDRDLWAKPVEPDADPFPIAQTDSYSETGGRFSPNSRWIAYESDESGRYEIYVRPFPLLGRPVRVTSNGGRNAIWNPNGHEIFYVERGSRVMAVPITLAGNGDVDVGTPAPLFTLSPGTAVAEVSLKGDRLLLDLPLEEVRPSPITIILNWAGHRKKN